jgi:DNA-binding MarR family transcriptional regulator
VEVGGPAAGAHTAGEALLRASRVLVGIAARSLADVDEVTLPQFRALVVVSARPVTTMSDLADALAVHATTATRLCDRLVDKRLLRRSPSADDRRATELSLTASGRRLVDRVTTRRRRDLDEIATRLPPGAVEAVRDALMAFAEAAGEPGDPRIDLFGWADGRETG